MLKRIALVSVIVILAAFIRAGSPPPSFSFTPAWQSLKIGGGGLMNNGSVALSDNTTVTSANTYGAYLRRTTGTCAGADNGGWGTTLSAPCWEQLITATSVPATRTEVNNLGQGVLEIAVCNNNTNDAYMFYNANGNGQNGSLYVTTNLKGLASSRSWAKTPLINTITGNVGASASIHNQIICDPANPNIVYASSNNGTSNIISASGNGLSGTGSTFATVTGITASSGVPAAMSYDMRPSAPTGTCAQFSGSPTCSTHFLIFSIGTGVYETINGGASYTLTSGGPTTSNAQCGGAPSCGTLRGDQFGNFWLANGAATIFKYTPNGTAGGGTWSTITPSDCCHSAFGIIAIDYTSASAGTLRLATGYVGGSVSVSTNGGSTWCQASNNQPFASSGSQPAWLGNANQNQGSTNGLFMTASDQFFDANGDLIMAAGIGNWRISSASVSCTATWQADTLGIENMVANHVEAAPGMAPVTAQWDRGWFTLYNPDAYPAHYFPDEGTNPSVLNGVNAGWNWDWATSASSNITGWGGTVGGAAGQVAGTSADDGVDWSMWGSFTLGTTNIGGDIAASTPSNFIVVPSGASNNVQFTTNGAVSFSASTLTGITGTVSANNQHGFHMAADRVNANTFCLIEGASKIWASTNSGSSFAKTYTGAAFANVITYNDALKAMPGQAATFYYSGGTASGTPVPIWKITKTTNECDTVTIVNSNIGNVAGMGFGAPTPGNTIPTIYFFGSVSGVYGLYQINNGGTTPVLISAASAAQTTPNNSTDFINDVGGDMNSYGRVYVGFNGSSYAYIDTADACANVGFDYSVVKPNQNLTGTSVTITAVASGKVAASITGVNFYLDGTTQIGSTQTGSGPYSVSFNASGQTVGSHTLTASAINSNCSSYNTVSNRTVMPIATH